MENLPKDGSIDPDDFSIAEAFCHACHLYLRAVTLRNKDISLPRRIFADVVKTAAGFYALGREMTGRLHDPVQAASLIASAVKHSQQHGLKAGDWNRIGGAYSAQCLALATSHMPTLPKAIGRWLGSVGPDGRISSRILREDEKPNLSAIAATLRRHICEIPLAPEQLPLALAVSALRVA